MTEQSNKLFALLDTLNIAHTTVTHQAVFTVAESTELDLHIPGAETKNLFLKDDRKQFWLISALQETQINLRALAKQLPAKNLRFAQADFLRQYLAVEPGSVTWFALMNDPANHVNAILDKAIFDHQLVGFHPLVNTATTVVTPNALIEFAKGINHSYLCYDFAGLEPLSPS